VPLSDALQLQPADSGRFKFQRDEGFHRELKRRVQAYFEQRGISQKANLAMFVKTAVLLTWFTVSYLALLLADATVWQRGLLAISLALAIAGIAFSVQHDANHGAYSKSKVVNRALGLTLDMLGGSSYIWRIKHNIAHHTYTGIAGGDSDIEVPFGRLVAAQPLSPYFRYQHLYLWALYGFFVANWQFYQDFHQLREARIAGNSFPRPRGADLGFLVAGKVAFFSGALVVPMFFHPWWGVLALYALTSVLLSLVLILVFQLAHSVEEAELPQLAPGEKAVPRSWAIHQVESAADFSRGNKLLSWYVGGLNFQIEHHLFPGICHVHYPQISAIVEQTCGEFGVRYSTNERFSDALASHLRWVRRLGNAESSLSA
jgi:linoleoyl-CoA desaturase